MLEPLPTAQVTQQKPVDEKYLDEALARPQRPGSAFVLSCQVHQQVAESVKDIFKRYKADPTGDVSFCSVGKMYVRQQRLWERRRRQGY